MGELPEQILAEKENIEAALDNLKTAMARSEKAWLIIFLMSAAIFIRNKDFFKGLIKSVNKKGRYNMVKIIVINNYGQFCHLIHRAVRDLDQEVELVKNTSTIEEILAKEPDGLILSGGPTLERAGNCREYVRELDLPILGICLGHQVMALEYGGKLRTGSAGGYAAIEIEIVEEDDILKGLGPKTSVWASHADEVSALPPDFMRLARSRISEIEAMKHKTKPLYGVQWHPEVSHTERGNDLLMNFFEVCRGYKKKH